MARPASRRPNEALLSAGKSAASLSTGIAALTKAGKIERSGDGEYAKAA